MADTRFKPGQPRSPNAGRKAGTPNKKTQEFMAMLQQHNFDPGEELIYCYRRARAIFEFRKKKGNLSGALQALEAAADIAGDIAQYTYPKKKAIEHSGEVGVKTFSDFIAAGSKSEK
jgi:hypothetical protein